ncbi:MAG: bifunctional oligoribonuclease/PAP phosphatase NrnA [Planctomycetota bacterium]
MPIDWRPLVELVGANESFVLTTHTRPDCDAIGSQMGFALGLESLGKRVRIINADAVPGHIAFIDPDNRVEVLGEQAAATATDAAVTAADAHAADVHCVLDTSAWGQLGDMADVIRESPSAKALIDHHVSGDDLGATEFKDTHAEATGRLVLDALEALGVTLTEAMATPLFYAIATDTGWFRFDSVTAATYQGVAKLVDAGASPTRVFQSLYDQNTLARVRLHGRVLAKIELHGGGRVACSWASAEDFAETGSLVADTEDVVNRLLSIQGVEVAVLLADLEPGKVKVSLRSRSGFNVRPIAEHFGGGGHNKAAGVRMPAPLDTAKQTMLAEVIGRLADA